ncbi:MAG: glycosyltransferase [Kiritimatiellae bacterium]|nr:glycosyltransferase [Kiritimatiellia bacterium]MDW8457686.1 glycosyltransferase [Verrucomicrobiota bacterium]
MKRVLIVFHSFDAWEMGAIRIRRIARHLGRFGFEPLVLTSPATGNSTADIPESVRILRANALDLAELYGRLRGARATHQAGSGRINRDIGLTTAINRWLMVPDKQIPWKSPALRLARELLRREPVDLIFGSLAPRTNLLVATQLAREFRLPCAVEFRDLWTANMYRHLDQPTRLHRALHARLERRVIRAADRVFALSQALADRLGAAHRENLRAPVETHYNFFDPAEFEGLPARHRGPGSPFIISYVGQFYIRRDPAPFFQGLRRFIDAYRLTPDQFRFRWAGASFGLAHLEDTIRSLQLDPYIDYLGHRAHREALALLCDSDLALIVQAPGDAVHVPGKLFEPLGARVPILAVSEPCETADLVLKTRAGFVAPHDPDAIAAALGEARRWSQSGRPWEYDETQRARFSVDGALSRLAASFEDLLAETANRR